MARCQSTTKSGKPCRAPATTGGLCFLHANPSQVRELGQRGGRRNRQQPPELPPATTMTIAQINEVLVDAVHRVRSNKLSARKAGALVHLCTALMKTLPAADMDARVTRLEEHMAVQAVPRAAGFELDSGQVNGSDTQGAETPELNGLSTTTQEEQVAQNSPAVSDCEQTASSKKRNGSVYAPEATE